ncbi:MAG: hypothetical protein EOM20_02725 [Spartobacteria bacterium]|nr:hypothetical protein [Spartobacteria bacterium]
MSRTRRNHSAMDVLILAAMLCLARAIGATADTGPWAFTKPDGTQHWYRVVSAPAGITWLAARNAAIDSGGYLACLTSTQENDFVFHLCDDPAYWHTRPGDSGLAGPWLGGAQAISAAEPDEGWEWISGEPMVFTNWAPGQPDDAIPNEAAMYFGETAGTRLNAWSDTRPVDTNVCAYVIEYDTSPRTVGLSQLEPDVAPDYVLFAPIPSTNTYLINNEGLCVHQWPSSNPPGQSVYMIPTGVLLRTAVLSNSVFSSGGEGGRVEMINWEGQLIWAFDYSTPQARQHHDIEMLPNGNILMLAWEYRGGGEALAAGRAPGSMADSELWPDHVIEVAPTGTYGGDIVWSWHVWDHLIQDLDAGKPNYGIVSNHPERININCYADRKADWNHCNGIDYHPDLDQIIISVRQFSEVWVIDHSTTPAEAAGSTGGRYGQGGDLLYRWGNPLAYNTGTTNDQRLFVQHNAQWIATNCPGAGHLLVFNNGNGRPGENYSSVDEWAPPVATDGSYTQQPDGAWGPTGACWSWQAPVRSDFFSHHISGAQRLTNGNTIVCDGEGGRFFEVTVDGREVWAYKCPVGADGATTTQGMPVAGNRVFRASRHAPESPELEGLTFAAGRPIEIYPGRSDFDGDGMEDTWEGLYYLNPAIPSDAEEDPDQDESVNVEEYIADTNPTDSNSFFSVAAFSNGLNRNLYFLGSTSCVYSLEYCEDMTSGIWTGVEDQTNQAGTVGINTLTDTNQTPFRSFRLRAAR